MAAFPYHDEIEIAARNHDLPVPLVKAVVEVESEFNPWAVRYEHAFFSRYIAGKDIVRPRAPCSRATEERLVACSFGLMQILGQTAREIGFDGTFLTELCIPEAGLKWGCRYLGILFDRHGDDGLDAVVAAYNAGSPRKNASGEYVNQAYVEKIRRAGGFE